MRQDVSSHDSYAVCRVCLFLLPITRALRFMSRVDDAEMVTPPGTNCGLKVSQQYASERPSRHGVLASTVLPIVS